MSRGTESAEVIDELRLEPVKVLVACAESLGWTGAAARGPVDADVAPLAESRGWTGAAARGPVDADVAPLAESP